MRSLSLPDSTQKDPPKSIEQIEKPIPEVFPQPQNLEQLEQAIANRLEQKITAVIEDKVEEKIISSFDMIIYQLEQKLIKNIESQMNMNFQGIISQISKKIDENLIDFKQLLSNISANKIIEDTTQSSRLQSASESQKSDEVASSDKPKNKRTTTATKNINNNDPRILAILDDLNKMNFAELEHKLAKSKKSKFAKPIYELRTLKLFTSIEDITTVRDLGEKTMQKIIENW